MSENGETLNETPSESDKMDISEVSDQVSPVSDQSEVVDNRSSQVQPLRLDNAGATNTTTTTTTTKTRGHQDPALSFEGLDLELPTLDAYQEEYVDFPSSPTHLKECLEVMPLEADSGTIADRSDEEEEEDTSIYQAVLSPDCQDVRLKKDPFEGDLTSVSGSWTGWSCVDRTGGMQGTPGSHDGETGATQVGSCGIPEEMGSLEPTPPGIKSATGREETEEPGSVRTQVGAVVTREGSVDDSTDGVSCLSTGNGARGIVTNNGFDPDRLDVGTAAKKGPMEADGASGNVSQASDRSSLSADFELIDGSPDGNGSRENAADTSWTFLDDTSFTEVSLSSHSDCETLGDGLMEASHLEEVPDKNDHKMARRLLTPNPEDLMLPLLHPADDGTNFSSNTVAVNTSSTEPTQDRVTMSSTYGNRTGNEPSPTEDDSFVFERRNSKRLARNGRDADNRFVEGLFVESRRKDAGLRRIAVDVRSLESPDPAEDNSPRVSPRDVSLLPNVIILTNPPRPKSQDRGGAANFRPVLILDPSTLDSTVAGDGCQERPGSLVASQRGGRRKIAVTADILNGPAARSYDGDNDVSSCGSRLSDTDLALSPDEEGGPDLAELLSGHDLDTPDEMEDSILERLGDTSPPPDPIPELSAVEERTEARSWRNCLVAGLERRIDMKVIEPYKRVLSHGGYLSVGSHNAIIVFSACFLPDRSRVDYDYVMDNLFLYVLATLDQLITEDYVLIYLHGATSRGCMPTFSWLKRCYQMIDRRLRKNLKGLYLVHPTFWLKTIVIMTRPFISSKFSRKLSFVESLAELAEIVPLEQASIPDRVKQYDQIRQSLESGN